MRFDRFGFSKYEGAAKIHIADCVAGHTHRDTHVCRMTHTMNSKCKVRHLVYATANSILLSKRPHSLSTQMGHLSVQRIHPNTNLSFYNAFYSRPFPSPRLAMASVVVAPVDRSRSTLKESTKKKHQIVLPFTCVHRWVFLSFVETTRPLRSERISR